MTGRRGVVSWCLFDWANSPFPAVVLTFVFPAYFAQAVAGENAASQWAFMTGVAALVIALASPVLGAVADHGGRRKPWLAACTVALAATTALLWLVHPDPSDATLLLWLVGVAVVAFELGMVFLNAFLPRLAQPGTIGRVSGWAWGLGYFGGIGGIALVLFGLVQADPPPFGLDPSLAEPVRAAGPVVALWLLVFCWPLFLWTPDSGGTGLSLGRAAKRGLVSLRETLRALPRQRTLGRFLLARMLYTDGINTLFAFGGIFAALEYGMGVERVLMFGLLLNFTAGAGAMVFGWLDDRIGARRTVLAGLAGLLATGTPILIIDSETSFWVLGALMGIFIGPVQSASRSLMARLTPEGSESEMFGLYALSGKATAFIGPWLVGIVVLASGSQRLGLATVLPFLVAGGWLLLSVPDGEGNPRHRTLVRRFLPKAVSRRLQQR